MSCRVLPSAFEWVYVYINKDTKEVGYVGRAKNAKRCARRIIEHRSDTWYSCGEWEIAFCPCLNRYESETMETVFINMYNPKWNKDKKGWGLPITTNIELSDAYGRTLEKQITIDATAEGLREIERQLRATMIKSGDWIKQEV